MAVGRVRCEDQRHPLVRAPRRRGGRRPHAVHHDAIVAAHHPADDPRRGVPGRERGRSARRRPHCGCRSTSAPGRRSWCAAQRRRSRSRAQRVEPRRRRSICGSAAGGALCWLPEPMLLAKGCDHRTTTRIRLDPGAALVFREVVVLGRHQEASGSLCQGIRVDVDERPLLRNTLLLGPRWPHADGPAGVDHARAVAQTLVVGAEPAACGVGAPVEGVRSASMELGPDAAMISELTSDPGRLAASSERAPDARGVAATNRAGQPSPASATRASPAPTNASGRSLRHGTGRRCR